MTSLPASYPCLLGGNKAPPPKKKIKKIFLKYFILERSLLFPLNLPVSKRNADLAVDAMPTGPSLVAYLCYSNKARYCACSGNLGTLGIRSGLIKLTAVLNNKLLAPIVAIVIHCMHK